MRRVFSDCFDWHNWPPQVSITGRPISGCFTSTGSNGPQDLSFLNHRHGQPQHVAALERIQRANGNQTSNSELLDGTGDPGQAIIEEGRPKEMAVWIRNLLYGILVSPEVEVYCLNREAETLALHRKFSGTPNEGTWIVTRRISDIRKEAMRVSGLHRLSFFSLTKPY